MTDELFYYLIEFPDNDVRGLACLEPYRLLDFGVTFLPDVPVRGEYLFIPHMSIKTLTPVDADDYATFTEDLDEETGEDSEDEEDDYPLIPGM